MAQAKLVDAARWGYTTIICTSKWTVLRVFENHGWLVVSVFFSFQQIVTFLSTKTPGNFGEF
jgi:hypothetical protein